MYIVQVVCVVIVWKSNCFYSLLGVAAKCLLVVWWSVMVYDLDV